MDECHGLLVTHDDGRVECLDDACVATDAPRHEWRASCADVDVPGLCDCHRLRVERGENGRLRTSAASRTAA